MRRGQASKEEARADLETLLGTNLVVSGGQSDTQPRPVLGQDLLHGLQVGLLGLINNLDMVDQAVTGIRNISGLGPIPTVPASLTGALILENGRVLLSQL